ncbi:MAG: cyclic pyranopterin monophosphate synthase MoaC [Elusimicrobiota bacterium]
MTPELTHIDARGAARMVDVADKPVAARRAEARAFLRMRTETLDALLAGSVKKGDAWAAARLAGILAAKKTPELIPLCHSVRLSSVEVSFRTAGAAVEVKAVARTEDKTGVEMEALVAAAAAALTLYDMAKSLDKDMVVGPVFLAEKSGGRSGLYKRTEIPEPFTGAPAAGEAWF